MKKYSVINKENPDWWWSGEVTKLFGEWFSQHSPRLLLSVMINDDRKATVYSGFLYEENDQSIWITAGHVVDELKYVIDNYAQSIEVLRWVDGLNIEGAEFVPVHNIDKLITYSLSKWDIDVGTIVIDGLDKINILKNKKLRFLNKNVWAGKPNNVIGYFFVGYPAEAVKLDEKEIDNKAFISCKSFGYCLPIEQVDFNPDNPDFYDDDKNFYGKIKGEIDIKSIKGMSGGPVFSIEITDNDEIRYHLIGVERGWDERSKIIKVEEINNVYNKLIFLNQSIDNSE